MNVHFSYSGEIHLLNFYNWNDRRLRRALLCFFSAIFQLMSAKFQTFANNLRRVWSSYTSNFDSSLRLLNCMFVSNFEAISHVTLVLGFENRPKGLA